MPNPRREAVSDGASALSNWIDAQGYGASGHFGEVLSTSMFAHGLQAVDDPQGISQFMGTVFDLI
jgi:hypothetical protein